MMMFGEEEVRVQHNPQKKGHTNHSEKSGKIRLCCALGWVEKWKSVSQFAEGEQKKQFYKESLLKGMK